jgi:hypothetical protein
MKKTNLYLTFLSILFLASCGKEKSDLNFIVYDTSSLFPATGETVTFSQIKSEILSPYCLSCHSSIGTESNLKKWITPGSPNNSSFFTSVENGSMPKNHAPLSTKYLELIRVYIQQMGPAPLPTPTPVPSTGITYAEIKSKVLTPYRCLNCHSVGTEAKLAKWINTSNPSRSLLYTEITSGSMPPSGSSPSSALENLVLQYIKDFASR